jgi:hypothetical protein
LIEAGAISWEKTALMAPLAGTPRVGPGTVVAGVVSVTPGRVLFATLPVLKLQVNGAAIGRPVARLLAPGIVAVYVVWATRLVPAVRVKVAFWLLASNARVPVGV